MTTSKHTPGPWAYDPAELRIYYADGDVEPTVAYVEYDNSSEAQAEADARLIAAAPELLAALKDAIALMGPLEDVAHIRRKQVWLAAIAKAEA